MGAMGAGTGTKSQKKKKLEGESGATIHTIGLGPQDDRLRQKKREKTRTDDWKEGKREGKHSEKIGK